MTHAVVGYIHPDFVRAEFMASVLAMTRKASTAIDEVLTAHSGPLIAGPRNELVARFLLEQRAPWLLMVDTDMVFTPDALDRLLAAADQRARPIVGGLCYSQETDGEQLPTAYELQPHADGAATFARYTTWPENDVFEVGATGAAFLLVHRYVFERIARGWAPGKCDPIWPWFKETAMGTRRMGEDLTFCLRARSARYKIYVHSGVQVGHMKSTMVGKVA